MKRKPLTHAARLLCALALSMSLAPAAFAADPSEPTQPSPCISHSSVFSSVQTAL